MMTEAPFFSERGAGRTVWVTMACVGDRVSTRVFPGTWLTTFGRSCPARYGGTQRDTATVAAQVLKADIPAGRAISPVAGLLAYMLTTRKTFAAHKRAAVLDVHTTQGKALVAATLAPLLTTTLTQFGLLPLRRAKLDTRKLARRCTTSASHGT